jgi:hypothetical protein
MHECTPILEVQQSTATTEAEMSRYGHLDMNELYSMLVVAESSGNEQWANEIRREARSRPAAERAHFEKYGQDPG